MIYVATNDIVIINVLPAYLTMMHIFGLKGYSRGRQDIPLANNQLDYLDKILKNKVKIEEIPKEYRNRDFFLYLMQQDYDNTVEYAKKHPKMFNKQLFKDYMELDSANLGTKQNIFEWMPVELIDEELLMCAILNCLDRPFAEHREGFSAWFYSVAGRKREALTRELYIMGAKLFAKKEKNGRNKFMGITPLEFRTVEYYFAMCIGNDTPVMEHFPQAILTPSFLAAVINDKASNIGSFSKDALRRKIYMENVGMVECWQAAIIKHPAAIKYIPLTDKRVEFFLSKYGTDSRGYNIWFKNLHEEYLKKKNKKPS